MRPFSVSQKFPQLVELPSQTNVATNTAVGPSDPGKSGIELQDLSKAAAAIRTGIKADTSAKPSFSLPNSPTKPQMHAVPNMQRINDDNNKTKRSSLGKTSGVFLVTLYPVGTVVAVLKPVKNSEIFANKLFKLLGMPIPNFGIENQENFNPAIQETIASSAVAGAPECKSLMVMRPILGRAMSEYDAVDLREFLLIENNLKLLGKSIVLDIFIGNADRIVPFMVKTINPDNIMFENKSIVFIDQIFKERSSQKGRVFANLAEVVNADPAMQINNVCVYKKYILPLVEKSLQKLHVARNETGATMSNHSYDDFQSSISIDQENRINDLLTTGICDAVALLIDSKDSVVNLCESNQRRKLDVEETYDYLEKLSTRFKKNNHAENIDQDKTTR